MKDINKKITMNIAGMNLAGSNGPKEELHEIATHIFDDYDLKELLKFNNCYSGLTWSANLKGLFRQSTLSEKERLDIISGIQLPFCVCTRYCTC